MDPTKQSPHDIIAKTDYMKQRMAEIERDMASRQFQARCKSVQVVINGDGCMVDVIFDPDCELHDTCSLSKYIVDAFNTAKKQVETYRQQALISMAEAMQTSAYDT